MFELFRWIINPLLSKPLSFITLILLPSRWTKCPSLTIFALLVSSSPDYIGFEALVEVGFFFAFRSCTHIAPVALGEYQGFHKPTFHLTKNFYTQLLKFLPFQSLVIGWLPIVLQTGGSNFASDFLVFDFFHLVWVHLVGLIPAQTERWLFAGWINDV